MKTTKRFIAMAAALTLTACAAMPMSIMTASAAGAEVTITGLNASVERTFEVYQVFTGVYNKDEGTFSELKWGSGVTSYDSTSVTPGALVADSVLDHLGNDARAIVDKLELGTVTKTVTSNADSLKIDGLADGYYVIKDVTNMDNKDDANSAWIVQVAAAEKTTSIAIKKETPSVDKSVQDETADAEAGAVDGWGESADHAINETFQFKLTATIPVSDDLAAYDTYMLKFNDTMSEGVTFEDIASVKISSATLKDNDALTLTSSQYTESATTASNKAGLTWDLKIQDVKSLVNAGGADIFGKEAIKVEVIYNAHLNENAIISTANGTELNVNNNKVDLQYSNNPDNTGTGTSFGKTPEDYVWVFTYKVDNTKYKISADAGNELNDATFTLHKGTATGDVIGVTWNETKSAYVINGTTTGSMTSGQGGTGKFNIIGLDAGKYVLVEDSAPAGGYNVANPVEFEITANHSENSNKTSADLELTQTNNGQNKIVDTKNSALPATGGIGTTLFILGGGCAAGIAGIYLISKKKTREEE